MNSAYKQALAEIDAMNKKIAVLNKRIDKYRDGIERIYNECADMGTLRIAKELLEGR